MVDRPDRSVVDIEKDLERVFAKKLSAEKARQTAQLIQAIDVWKKKRNAIILGHNYMPPEILQFIADLKGDSLELCRLAEKAQKDVIVFCGVKFMAESAKVLNPSRTVLLPALNAGCSLAAAVNAGDVRALRERFPGLPVVAYINTYAEVKAEIDVCCTSSNAAQVVSSFGARDVIFLPDRYLAANVAKQTGRKLFFSDDEGVFKPGGPKLITWRGSCEIHEQFTVDDVAQARRRYPGVVILAHPECPPEVVDRADYCASTSSMMRYVANTDAPSFLLLTEKCLAENLAVELPHKTIILEGGRRCPHMDEVTLPGVLDALQTMKQEIKLSSEMIGRARRSLDRMLEIG